MRRRAMQIDQTAEEDRVAAPVAPGETLLQQIVAPARPERSVLHHRVVEGGATYDGDALHLEAGTRVSFNCYFSCFYASYWTTYTVVDEVRVVAVVRGAVTVELYRETDEAGTQLVSSTTAAPGSGRDRLVMPLAVAGDRLDAGRWFVEITADEAGVVEMIGFVTSTEPLSLVRLSAGLCTYRGDAAVVPVLRELVAAAHEQVLTEIVVVNHGGPFEDVALRELVADDRTPIRVVDQPNLGASGGFARTMTESLDGGRATHHLTVEDDAELDHRVLGTFVTFLSYARSNVVVGAHMANLRRPTSLYHSVLRVLPGDIVVFTHPNLPLEHRHALNCFNQVERADFTGWWCTAIPHAVIESVGLPASFFVQYDDLEYGLRLQDAGVPTVMLPGVAAWHEPFDAKPLGWKAYYDLRNRLIVTARYPRRARAERWTDLARTLVTYVAQHDYVRTTWLLQAIEDYVAGPDALLASSPSEIHSRVMHASLRVRPTPVDAATAARAPRGAVLPPPRGAVASIALLGGRLATVLLLPGRDPARAVRLHEEERQPQNVGRHPWILANDVAHHYERYTASRREIVRLLPRVVRALASYRRRGRAAARAWRDQLPGTTTREAWEPHFRGEAAATVGESD